jgi:hypothetical protein
LFPKGCLGIIPAFGRLTMEFKKIKEIGEFD